MTGLRKQHDKFLATEIDDETILLDLDGGELLALDGPAQAIWQALDQTSDPAAVIALLSERYDARPGDIARDVREFLLELRTAGLLA